MAKISTDLDQSMKLAEILPIESADGGWYGTDEPLAPNTTFWLRTKYSNKAASPAWSLAALISILPVGSDIVKEQSDDKDGKYMCTVGYKNDILSTFSDNPIDACYELILKLNELEML